MRKEPHGAHPSRPWVILGLLLLAVLSAVAQPGLDAQILRGVVLEEHGENPVSGGIVTVLTLDGRTAAVGMTNEFGRFALRAPVPGEFYVEVKRIGVKRTRFPQFTLKADESPDLSLTVLPLPISQPTVHVTASSTCRDPAVEGRDVALLWEDARAALTATILTQNQRRFLGKVVRFNRRRSPRSMRVVFEERDERSGVLATPFASVPADQLSREGYVLRQPNGAASYRAPDADVLLSDSFLADHCFLGSSPKMRDRERLGWRSHQPLSECSLTLPVRYGSLKRRTSYARSTSATPDCVLRRNIVLLAAMSNLLAFPPEHGSFGDG